MVYIRILDCFLGKATQYIYKNTTISRSEQVWYWSDVSEAEETSEPEFTHHPILYLGFPNCGPQPPRGPWRYCRQAGSGYLQKINKQKLFHLKCTYCNLVWNDHTYRWVNICILKKQSELTKVIFHLSDLFLIVHLVIGRGIVILLPWMGY